MAAAAVAAAADLDRNGARIPRARARRAGPARLGIPDPRVAPALPDLAAPAAAAAEGRAVARAAAVAVDRAAEVEVEAEAVEAAVAVAASKALSRSQRSGVSHPAGMFGRIQVRQRVVGQQHVALGGKGKLRDRAVAYAQVQLNCGFGDSQALLSRHHLAHA